MKKASDILLLVGGIVAAVCIFIYLLCGVMFTVMSLPFFTPYIAEGIREGIVTTAMGDISMSPEELAALIQMLFTVYAVIFYIITVFTVVSCIFAFSARKAQSSAMYILNIVFGVIGCTVVNTVGGILGLIALKKSRQQ